MAENKKKLAIVCSYNVGCGNASYTEVLYQEFSKNIFTTVLPLDPILQKQGRFFEKKGDDTIRALARQLKDFDYVNIQFEAGLYGGNTRAMVRRLKMLIQSCDNVLVTFHRIDLPEQFSMKKFVPLLLKGKLLSLAKYVYSALNGYGRMFERIFRYLNQEKSKRKINVLVHTDREKRNVTNIFGFSSVVNYPLTFLDSKKRELFLSRRNSDFMGKFVRVKEGAKYVGIFGFISPYKSYETVIRAMELLPDNYHLMIFGGQHPMSISENIPIDPYIGRLLKLIYRLDQNARKNQIKWSPLVDRVHFLGTLNDDDFISALASCDIVTVPYLEVNQGMSGICALSLEVGANAIFSNNIAFNELNKYCPNGFETFDIGNYIQLYQKIVNYENRFRDKTDFYFQKYNIEKNIEFQLNIFSSNQTLG